jgi:hypothetical protein
MGGDLSATSIRKANLKNEVVYIFEIVQIIIGK